MEKPCKHRDKKVYPFDRCETFTKQGRNECNKCRGALQTERRTTKTQELEDALAKMTLERDEALKKQNPELEEQLKESTAREVAVQASLAEEQLHVERLELLLTTCTREKNEYHALATAHETTLEAQEGEIARLKQANHECLAMLAAREATLESMNGGYQSLEDQLKTIQAEKNDLQEKCITLGLSNSALTARLLEESRRDSLSPKYGRYQTQVCKGCLEDQPNQLAHCDPITGCLKTSSSSKEKIFAWNAEREDTSDDISQSDLLSTSFSSLSLVRGSALSGYHHTSLELQNAETVDQSGACSPDRSFLIVSSREASPTMGRKKYKPENCEKCGFRIYKRGRKSASVKYCDCNTQSSNASERTDF